MLDTPTRSEETENLFFFCLTISWQEEERRETIQSVKVVFFFFFSKCWPNPSLRPVSEAQILFHGLAFCPFQQENTFILRENSKLDSGGGKVEALCLSISDSGYISKIWEVKAAVGKQLKLPKQQLNFEYSKLIFNSTTKHVLNLTTQMRWLNVSQTKTSQQPLDDWIFLSSFDLFASQTSTSQQWAGVSLKFELPSRISILKLLLPTLWCMQNKFLSTSVALSV